MVLDLQGQRRTLTDQLAHSEVRLFQGSRPLRAEDVKDSTGMLATARQSPAHGI